MSLLESIFGRAPPSGSADEESDEAAHEKESTDEEEDHSGSDRIQQTRSRRLFDRTPILDARADAPSNDQLDTDSAANLDGVNNEDDGDEDIEGVDPTQSPRNGGKANNEDVDERTIFVGNLPVCVTRKALIKLFQPCGKVESARIRSVAVAGIKLPPHQAGNQNLVRKIGFNTGQVDSSVKQSIQGYVVFASAESIPVALKMNATPLSSDSGAIVLEPSADTLSLRRMRVDHVNPSFDPTRTIFVGNLPYHADEVSLHEHCIQNIGTTADLADANIEGIRIIRDKDTFQCKGFAYVLWKNPTLVAAALRHLPDTVYLKRPLRVQICGKRYKTNSKHEQRKQRAADHHEHRPDRKRSVEEDSRDQRGKKPRHNPERNDPQTQAAPAEAMAKKAVGALRRVLEKTAKGSSARPRGIAKKHSAKRGNSGAVGSKRAAIDAKVEKRVKKLEKRVKKGMGKSKGK
jgi:nucleolar protein 12